MCIGAGAVPAPLGRRGRQARRGLLLPLVGPQSLPPCVVLVCSQHGAHIAIGCYRDHMPRMPAISWTAPGAPWLSLIALPAVHALSKGTQALWVDINLASSPKA